MHAPAYWPGVVGFASWNSNGVVVDWKKVMVMLDRSIAEPAVLPLVPPSEPSMSSMPEMPPWLMLWWSMVRRMGGGTSDGEKSDLFVFFSRRVGDWPIRTSSGVSRGR
jgi:hypothetical protein